MEPGVTLWVATPGWRSSGWAPATRTVPTNRSPGFVVVEMMFSHVPSSRIVNDLCVIGRMWDVLKRVYRSALGA